MARYLCKCGRIAREGRTTCEACRFEDQARRAVKVRALRTPEYRRFRADAIREDRPCVYCGRRMRDLEPGERMTVDHVIARARRGAHLPSNWVWACSRCNEEKGAR